MFEFSISVSFILVEEVYGRSELDGWSIGLIPSSPPTYFYIVSLMCYGTNLSYAIRNALGPYSAMAD